MLNTRSADAVIEPVHLGDEGHDRRETSRSADMDVNITKEKVHQHARLDLEETER